MKIAICTKHGGFGLSPEATKRLVIMNAKCVTATPETEYGSGPNSTGRFSDLETYVDVGDGFKTGKFVDSVLYKDGVVYGLNHGDDTRKDADLIRVCEEMGQAAASAFCRLAIVEIPDDVDFEIDEYDGAESIHEKHRIWYGD